MAYIKTYILNYFYKQYLVLITMAPRISRTHATIYSAHHILERPAAAFKAMYAQ